MCSIQREREREREREIQAALNSFGAGSGAGLFAYRPFILQQCARTQSDSFLRALCAVVNLLASGEAPASLRGGSFYCPSQIQGRYESPLFWWSVPPRAG